MFFWGGNAISLFSKFAVESRISLMCDSIITLPQLTFKTYFIFPLKAHSLLCDMNVAKNIGKHYQVMLI